MEHKINREFERLQNELAVFESVTTRFSHTQSFDVHSKFRPITSCWKDQVDSVAKKFAFVI